MVSIGEQPRLTPTRNDDKPLIDPEVWVDEHGDALFRFAMLRLRNRDAAEEAVQDCFVSALAAHARFEGQSTERTWLIGILRHKIIDQIRKRSRANHISAVADRDTGLGFFDGKGYWRLSPSHWPDDPSAAMQRSEFRAVLGGCLSKLPQGVGDAFVLREVDRMDGKEICHVLGISQANLWQRLHRARLLLRRCLELNWFKRDRAPRSD